MTRQNDVLLLLGSCFAFAVARNLQHTARVSTDDGAEEYVGYKGRLGDGVLTVDDSPFVAGLSCTVGTISVVPNVEPAANAGCLAGDEWCHVRTHPSSWRVGDIIVGGAHWGCSVERKRPEHPTPFYVEIVEAVPAATAAAAAAAGEGSAGALTFLVEIVSPLECFQHMSLGMYRLPSAGAGSGAIASGFDMRRGFDWAAAGLHRQDGGGHRSSPDGSRSPRDAEGDGDDVPFHFPLHAASQGAHSAAAAAQHRRGGPSLFGETETTARVPSVSVPLVPTPPRASGDGSSHDLIDARAKRHLRQLRGASVEDSTAERRRRQPDAAVAGHGAGFQRGSDDSLAPRAQQPDVRACASRNCSRAAVAPRALAIATQVTQPEGIETSGLEELYGTVSQYAKFAATTTVGDKSLELMFKANLKTKLEGKLFESFAEEAGGEAPALSQYGWPPSKLGVQPVKRNLLQTASESAPPCTGRSPR